MSVQVAISGKLAQHHLDKSGALERLTKRKNLQAVLIRYCQVKGLRFFIREEINNIQHVAWIGEAEVLEWTNTGIEAHFHWMKEKLRSEGITRQRNYRSSGINKSRNTTTNTDENGKRLSTKGKGKKLPAVSEK